MNLKVKIDMCAYNIKLPRPKEAVDFSKIY